MTAETTASRGGPPAPAPGGAGLSWIDGFWLLGALLAAAALGAAYLHLRRRFERDQQERQWEAARFEETLLRTFGAGPAPCDAPCDAPSAPASAAPSDAPSASPSGAPCAAPCAAPLRPDPFPFPASASASAFASAPALPGDMERALAPLLSAGLVESVGDRLPLDPALPPALRLVLRGGRRALLFPARTPLSLVRQHPAERVFLAAEDGPALRLQPLPDFVADALFPGPAPGGPPGPAGGPDAP